MRLLFVDHAGVLGGAELSLLDLAAHHRARSRVVLFADGPFREALADHDVCVDVLPLARRAAEQHRDSGWRSLGAAPAVLAAAARLARLARGADLVHCNSQKAFVVGALAGAVARRPVVWHLRDMLTADHFGVWNRRLVVALANALATRVICNSAATARAFVAAGGQAGRAVVVYNGIDAEPPSPAAAAAVRAELGLAGVPLVGAFSRLAPWKGQHVLLDALSQLPGVQAVIVGDALFGEQAYAQGLRDQARRLGSGERVRFLGFRRDVSRLMGACDAVVHTAIAPEPFGRMIVEGMLAGRPVVASDDGGAREIVTDGDTGWLVPPGDPQALAATLRTILEQPTAAAVVAARGRAHALARFSRERMLVDFDAAIQAILDPPAL